MGKRLTRWEKEKREREREKEAEFRRKNAEERREIDRKAKEKKEQLLSKIGSSYANLFELLLQGAANLVNDKKIRKLSAKTSLELPPKITVQYPGDMQYELIKVDDSAIKFKTDKELVSLKKQLETTYLDYESALGSFFADLFGKTEKKYNEFIRETEIAYEALEKKESARKSVFKEKVEYYLSEVENFNNKCRSKLAKDNIKRKIAFEELKSSIRLYNSKRKSVLKEIDDTLSSFDSNDFEKAFVLGLPIEFSELDEMATELKRNIKELEKDFYNSPSENFNYGISKTQNSLFLYLIYKDGYFPFPSEQQVNSTVKGYSVRALTKKNKKLVEENMVHGAALSYAGYAFNSSPNIEDIYVIVGKETVDGVTGFNTTEWINKLRVDKATFSKIKFDKIIPSQTTQLFHLDEEIPIPNEINWIKDSNKSNPFTAMIEDLNHLHEELVNEIQKFGEELFVRPSGISKIDKSLIGLKKINKPS